MSLQRPPVCVCVCVCVCSPPRAHTHAFLFRLCVCVFATTRAHTHAILSACVCVFATTCTHTLFSSPVCVCLPPRAHTHTHAILSRCATASLPPISQQSGCLIDSWCPSTCLFYRVTFTLLSCWAARHQNQTHQQRWEWGVAVKGVGVEWRGGEEVRPAERGNRRATSKDPAGKHHTGGQQTGPLKSHVLQIQC